MSEEDISADDKLSRWIFNPPMMDEFGDIVWLEVFTFQDGRSESLVLLRFLNGLSDVHLEGCRQERIANDNKIREGKKPKSYGGCVTAVMSAITSIRLSEGHGFEVLHTPREGMQYHADISFQPNKERNFTKQHRMVLRRQLQQAFSERSLHSCHQH